MLSKEMLTTMFDYNAATNVRLLECAAKVSDEQLDTPIRLQHWQPAANALAYVLVEAGWGRFCRGIEVDRTKPPPIEPTAAIATLQAFQSEEHAQMRPFLDGLSDDDLTATLPRKYPDGTERTFIRWQVLVHILYHSAQHRSEAAELLTRYGQSPGDTDFIFFVAPKR